MHTENGSHWLERYHSGYHEWKTYGRNGDSLSGRPLGLVETMFDCDGRRFEGRADVHGVLKLKIKGRETREQLRKRIRLAWANFRAHHPLTRAIADKLPSGPIIDETGKEGHQRYFVIRPLGKSSKENLEDSSATLTFVEDFHAQVDPADFLKHVENTGRAIDPSKSLSKLFVLPLIKLSDGTFQLPLVFIFAHQITDGLTMYNWLPHFNHLLNQSQSTLLTLLTTLSSLSSPNPPKTSLPPLPPAQEDLYPPIPGTPAHQRWSWLLLRILRHIRRPLPPAFPNPLTRTHPLPPGHARPMPPSYPSILNYHPTPPLNTHRAHAVLSPAASRRFHAIALSAGVSLGATAFALVGLVMQTLHASLHPRCDDEEARPSFIASFPLNPRAFLSSASAAPADSLMLGFSSGLVLPFLPLEAPVGLRMRVLARRAQAQLRRYQRREVRRSKDGARAAAGARELLQDLYLMTAERSEMLLGEEERMGWVVQGGYPARGNPTGATCGVSWVGAVEALMRGPMDAKVEEEGKRKDGVVGGNGEEQSEFEAAWMDVDMGIRVREREFLVGGSTLGHDRVSFAVSYDGNAYDEALVRKWEEKMETILLEDAPNSRL
ncbi:hypothetical protein EV356DRAFT_455751 [Viridothelium virens]|uniref:CoA-dependent acyltransferase n=1 Tax=Viridothelium virens TaxID=1048519 RepID=A0A6A6GUL4_VIRVR|nr:hypothetical protein EV356DRAFT_455751 [Viridothelium virens]